MDLFSIEPSLVEKNISNIEEMFDVSTLRYEGFFVWNAVKALLAGLHTWSYKPNGYLEVDSRKTIAAFNLGSSVRFNELYIQDNEEYFISSRCRNTLKNKYDVLFVEAFDSLSVAKSGEVENRIFQPFKEALRDFSQLSLLPYDNNIRKINLSGEYIFYKKCLEKYLRNQFLENNIKGLKELFQLIKKEKVFSPFNYDYMDRWIKSVFIRSWVFVSILQKIEPKLVFLTSFYSSERMAIVLACKRLGIKTIETQHGLLGPNFHNLSSANIKRELIPDYFWLWGEDAKQYVQKNENNSNVIVGGKLDLFRQKKLIKQKEKSEANSILIIEQYTHNHIIDMVEKAIKSVQDSDAKILLRLHPRSHHLISTYKEYFANYDNFEVERTTLLPLYELMNEVKIVLVESSTVAHEAVFFDKLVIVYGKNAREYFSKYIDRNVIIYFDNYSDVFDNLPYLKSNNNDKNQGYFSNCEHSSDKGLRFLCDILNK